MRLPPTVGVVWGGLCGRRDSTSTAAGRSWRRTSPFCSPSTATGTYSTLRSIRWQSRSRHTWPPTPPSSGTSRWDRAVTSASAQSSTASAVPCVWARTRRSATILRCSQPFGCPTTPSLSPPPSATTSISNTPATLPTPSSTTTFTSASAQSSWRARRSNEGTLCLTQRGRCPQLLRPRGQQTPREHALGRQSGGLREDPRACGAADPGEGRASARLAARGVRV